MAGSLDLNFNGTGKVLTELSGLGLVDEALAVAVQPDGKIVVAGRSSVDGIRFTLVALARYNADGTLDSGFGTLGRQFTSFGEGGAEARALALQADGKIVVAGRSCPTSANS